MELSALGNDPSALAGSTASQGISSLGSDDFFKLLIAQLTNQDPLEPTSNEELLNQISSIRDIELSTNLSRSLSQLTEQQRFASVTSFVGQFVSGRVDDGIGNQRSVQGTVVAVRFDEQGAALLELEDGSTLGIDQVTQVMDGAHAGVLLGQFVRGLDRVDPLDPRALEGIVVGTSQGDDGRVRLELDSGDQLLLSDVFQVGSDDPQAA